jgi:polar amino acid transport system substrate-binding protein
MKKRVLLIILPFLFMFTTALSAQDKFVLSCGGVDHPFYNISLDILTEAYSRLGIDLEIQELPLERAIQVANSGSVDGELFRGEIEKSDYPNVIKVPVVIALGEISVFTKNKDFVVNGWESLRPYIIATQIGLKPVELNTEGMNVKKALEWEQLFKMLDSGRVDIVVLPKDVGLSALESMNLQGIRVLEPPVQRDFIYHYLNVKHSDIVPKLTAILKQMQTEGLFPIVE